MSEGRIWCALATVCQVQRTQTKQNKRDICASEVIMDPATDPARNSQTAPEIQDTKPNSVSGLKNLMAKSDVSKSKTNPSVNVEYDGKETDGKKPTVGQRVGKVFQSTAAYMTNFVNALN